jgi:hypothetical protein
LKNLGAVLESDPLFQEQIFWYESRRPMSENAFLNQLHNSPGSPTDFIGLAMQQTGEMG